MCYSTIKELFVDLILKEIRTNYFLFPLRFEPGLADNGEFFFFFTTEIPDFLTFFGRKDS